MTAQRTCVGLNNPRVPASLRLPLQRYFTSATCNTVQQLACQPQVPFMVASTAAHQHIYIPSHRSCSRIVAYTSTKHQLHHPTIPFLTSSCPPAARSTMPRDMTGTGRYPPQPRYPPFAFYSAVRLADPEMLAKILDVDPYFVTQVGRYHACAGSTCILATGALHQVIADSANQAAGLAVMPCCEALLAGRPDLL